MFRDSHLGPLTPFAVRNLQELELRHGHPAKLVVDQGPPNLASQKGSCREKVERECLRSRGMLPTFIKFATSRRFEDDEPPLETKPTLVSEPSSPPTETKTVVSADESASIVSSISDQDLLTPSFRVQSWDKKTHYSTFIRDSLRYLKRNEHDVVMLFESPSTADKESAFYNSQVYKFHDYPPASAPYKTML